MNIKVNNRQRVVIFLLLSVTFTLQAQEVITTSGGSGTTSGSIITWTIGEPVTESISGTGTILTQGFNQGDLIITIIKNPEEAGLIIKVFPNPAHDRLNISIVPTEIENLRFILTDINGIILSNNKLQGDETDIPLSDFSPALYLLKIYKGRKVIGVYKIIKK